ncbi:murein biosynthesis integral membrane protein MurJ [Pseudoxanthomonas dokdonensis]|uniref:Probable lipid II flippase MurJ n=1 Tax=Pseudoxanthomonas dokdonensis TaxID=344882 RepID=A0A0R0CGL4_9GAMM|nr:murein biosynthesis integral membrane protein MurJ [Pseudoxanthomonas dokdonensis]KRG68988.1 membrane protein [Pseudoxanthomonas dokdonensis]
MSGNRLLRSSAVFSAMTLLSRVFGLVRDQVYAFVFGANAAMDIFLIAFRIPNFMRRLSAEGSFSMAFVPVLAEYKETHSQAEVKALIDRITGTLAGFLLALTALVLIFANQLAPLFDSNMSGAEADLLAEMLRITFPYALFISLASLAGSILNSYGRFAIPALSPVLMNITMIAAALGLAPLMNYSVTALAWGVFAAGLVQLLFQLPALAKIGLLPRPRWDLAHAGVRKVLRLMVPTLFGSSVVQFNLLFNSWVAFALIGGSVSWLYYSDRLLEFPLGMFGVAIGTVILPHLSSRHAAADKDGYSKGLDWGFRLCLLLGLPACVGLILCAEPLMATLFQYRRFTAHDSWMSSLSLMAQATAIPAFLLVKVLAPAFYSRQDTRTPVKAAVVAVVVNVACVLALIGGVVAWSPAGQAALASSGGDYRLAAAQIPGMHALLALSIAIAGWVNTLQLTWYLRQARVYRRQPGWGRFLRQLLLATLAMGLVVGALRWQWQDWTPWLWWQRGWRLTAMVVAGGAVYAALLWLQGIRPRDLRGH